MTRKEYIVRQGHLSPENKRGLLGRLGSMLLLLLLFFNCSILVLKYILAFCIFCLIQTFNISQTKKKYMSLDSRVFSINSHISCDRYSFISFIQIIIKYTYLPGFVLSIRIPETKHNRIFLLGKSHRQRSLAGYSQWGWKELDKT